MGVTRRDTFAGAAAIVAAPAIIHAAAVGADPMLLWREGYGGWIEDPAIWPLMVEANALELRPDQVTGIYFKGPGGPRLDLATDKGEVVRIYHDHTLWLRARSGRVVL